MYVSMLINALFFCRVCVCLPVNTSVQCGTALMVGGYHETLNSMDLGRGVLSLLG